MVEATPGVIQPRIPLAAKDELNRGDSGSPLPAIDAAAKATTLRRMNDVLKARLEEVRVALLALHKTLVDAERASYEQTMGAIQSPTHFLQLLTADPWFAWLQPLSQLIVSLDELEEADTPLTAPTVEAVLKQARLLLTPSEGGEGFARHYFEALQRDADVVIAHADLMKLLARLKAQGPSVGRP